MTCTRERKEQFILSFGKISSARTGNDGVTCILAGYGLEVFQDWAIDLMVLDLIATARLRIRLNRENRRIYAARQLRVAS